MRYGAASQRAKRIRSAFNTKPPSAPMKAASKLTSSVTRMASANRGMRERKLFMAGSRAPRHAPFDSSTGKRQQRRDCKIEAGGERIDLERPITDRRQLLPDAHQVRDGDHRHHRRRLHNIDHL